MGKAWKILIAVAVTSVAAAVVFGCKSVDDDRIPAYPVNIGFRTLSEWDNYGVNGALEWREFIRQERKPSGFFYTEGTYTGFGGVLLVCDALGNQLAYDLACPVECRQDVRIKVSPDDNYLAECPGCHSRYDVFSLFGNSVSGPAAERGYGLRRYNVGPGRGGEYRVVTN